MGTLSAFYGSTIPEPEFNVAAYGAVGNGVTDDSAAINSAISAASTAGGGVVLLPPGTYAIASLVGMRDNVTLSGYGATLKAISSLGYGVANSNSAAVLHNAGLLGLTIDMASIASSAGLTLHAPQWCHFRDLNILNCLGGTAIGIYADVPFVSSPPYHQNAALNQFDSIRIDTCANGVLLQGSDSNRVVTLNRFVGLSAFNVSGFGILFMQWTDTNHFYGTELSLIANNAVGVTHNYSGGAVDRGCYANNFWGLSVDMYGLTGTTGIKLNAGKQFHAWGYETSPGPLGSVGTVLNDVASISHYVHVLSENPPRMISKGEVYAGGSFRDQGGAVYNVAAYGAVGNGVTDDSAAINSAISAASTAGGGVVLLPSGTYVVSSSLVMQSKVSLCGTGIEATLIKAGTALNADVISSQGFAGLTGMNSSAGIYNWGLSNLSIDGNKAAQTSGSGIRVYGYGFIWQNIRVRNCFSDGIYSEWGTQAATVTPDAMDAQLSNVKVHDNGGKGLNWCGPHDTQFSNVQSFLNAGAGFHFQALTAATGGAPLCNNCHAWNNTGAGWIIEGQNGQFTGCQSEGSSGPQVIILGNTNIWVGGTVFAAGAATPVGFQIGDATHSVAGIEIDSLVTNCTSGAVNYSNDGGASVIHLVNYQTSGPIYIGTPNVTTWYELQTSGQAPDGTVAKGGGVYRAVQATSAFVVAQTTGVPILSVNTYLPSVSIGGPLDVTAVGSGLKVAEGTNAKQGTAVLVAGTVVVSNTSVTASSRILLTSQVDGGTPGFLRVSTRTAGTSFTILSSSASDTSTVAYQIFEPG